MVAHPVTIGRPKIKPVQKFPNHCVGLYMGGMIKRMSSGDVFAMNSKNFSRLRLILRRFMGRSIQGVAYQQRFQAPKIGCLNPNRPLNEGRV